MGCAFVWCDFLKLYFEYLSFVPQKTANFTLGFCDFCKLEPYSNIFVSPELSSGRDLVIQMSVRRVPSAVRRPPSMVFCPEHISGTV